ncbi:hypothetical protein TNCV_1628261 [Trichonephila clavipes]|nr:hypothetical protein TNCV_1628261 [Trichonephila clavipes]
MVVGARSVGTSISKTEELQNFSRAAVINIHKKGITKQKTGSQRQDCGRHRLMKFRTERKITKVVQSNNCEEF